MDDADKALADAAVERAFALMDEVAADEEALKLKKAQLKTMLENDVPEQFLTLNLTQHALPDGRSVTIEQEVHCSVKVEDRPQLFAWLRAQEAGDMIKREYSVEFGRGEERKALVFEEFARRMLPTCDVKLVVEHTASEVQQLLADFIKTTFPEHKLVLEEKVHASTLKAFVRKKFTKGEAVPDYIGTYTPRVAVLARPEAKGERAAF